MELNENQLLKLIAKKYFDSDWTVTRILRETTKHGSATYKLPSYGVVLGRVQIYEVYC